MFKHWRMLAPALLGAAALTGMLTIFAMISVAEAPIAEVVDQGAVAKEGVLPAERAEMYRTLLLKSLRTEPYLAPPREDTVLQEVGMQLGPNASKAEIQAAVHRYYSEFHRKNDKVSGPNPLAYLGRMKAREMAAIAGQQAAPALAGTPEVLTVMLNFSGIETYTTDDAVAFHSHCLTDTSVFTPGFQVVIDGPRFNESAPPTDNKFVWLDPATSPTGGFTKEYYDLLMYSETGYTAIMRPELPNPWDGGNGFNFSGVTFRNYFVENSRGLYIPQGEVVEVTIPEAVSYFGAARCNDLYFDDGFNEVPAYTIAISAAQQINTLFPGAANATNSDFTWAKWDQEDVIDFDNDGNFFEPDGYVDHFFLIQAGRADGGAYGQFLIWPNSNDVNPAQPGVGPTGNQLGGYQVAVDGAHPLGSIWVLNYTVSDEVGGLGVLVHEYAHDIGLPDNYGIDGSAPNPGYWDVMAGGNFGGGLFSMQPVHMTIWDKEFLGWNVPVEIDLAATSALGEANASDFTLGQQSKPPVGTIDGLRINLPDVTSSASIIPFDANMWWSNVGDDRNESIARNFTLQAGETATVSAQIAYFIEVDYDYFYWEISSTLTGGWIPLEVFSGTTQLTTDDNPNGLNPTGNGINGSSGDWVQATATITPGAHAGGEVAFRFRYFTDAGVQEEGVFLDNISMTGTMSGLLFSDDAESGDIWTHFSEGVNGARPWLVYDGTRTATHYYLVEWRNAGEATGAHGTSNTAAAFDIAGFDIGLNRMFWISELDDDLNLVRADPFFMHTPAMLIWYVNNTYENNTLNSTMFDPPADGPKGRVLLADANPAVFLVDDPVVWPNPIGGGDSSFDAAYTLVDRPSFTLTSDLANTGSLSTTLIPGAKAKSTFHDRIGVAAGYVEATPEETILLDAGVVLPTVDNTPYGAARESFRHTGNPGLDAFGINLQVLEQADDGTWGKVRFWLDDDTIFFDKKANTEKVRAGQRLTYTLTLKDASGTRYADDFNYTYNATLTDQLPAGVTYVPDSLAVTDGPWTTEPSTVTITGNTITWVGTLGGNPLDVPDAVIEYAVTVHDLSVASAANAIGSSAVLKVEQILISTDTFGQPLDLPYLWPKQQLYVATSQVEIGEQVTRFPIIHR